MIRKKMYAAYKAAMEHKGQPTVILAKTVKGYGLGEAGEGRNITHQQKKLNEKELREFRARFDIPISDEEIAETPFYRPAETSHEIQVPARTPQETGRVPAEARDTAQPLKIPDLDAVFGEFLKGPGRPDVRLPPRWLSCDLIERLLRNKKIGRQHCADHSRRSAHLRHGRVVPRRFGIYSPKGQLYEPVDRASASVLPRSQGRTDSRRRNQRGGIDGFVHRGRNGLREPSA